MNLKIIVSWEPFHFLMFIEIEVVQNKNLISLYMKCAFIILLNLYSNLTRKLIKY